MSFYRLKLRFSLLLIGPRLFCFLSLPLCYLFAASKKEQDMKLIYFFITALLLTSVTGFAQTGRDVRGTVIDTTKATLPGSSVKLITDKDSVTTITDSKGAFIFNGI